MQSGQRYKSITLITLALLYCACSVNPPTALNAVITGASTASENARFQLSGNMSTGDIASYHWEQINIATGKVSAQIDTANTGVATIQAYVEEASEQLSFRLTVSDRNGMQASAEHSVTVSRGNIDLDGDGLMEIRGLTMLHNMRYNRLGSGYRTTYARNNDDSDIDKGSAIMQDPGIQTGCPNSICNGYELVGNLSFDKDGDGKTFTFTPASYSHSAYYNNPSDTDPRRWMSDSYTPSSSTLDPDDDQAPYFVVAEGGWKPISPDAQWFKTTFDGNGFTIRGLALQAGTKRIGFIGHTAPEAVIRNVGIIAGLVDSTNTNPDAETKVGILVGDNHGTIVSSFVSDGFVSGSIAGNKDSDTEGSGDKLGGLVGHISAGRVIASFANSTIYGDGGDDEIGGLVGELFKNDNSIIPSIFASYATGSLYGGPNFDQVGGLIGDGDKLSDGSISGTEMKLIASYSTAHVDGGLGPFVWQASPPVYHDANKDIVGVLLADAQSNEVVDASYGFGTVSNRGTSLPLDPSSYSSSDFSGIFTSLPQGVSTATSLTVNSAGQSWNSALSNSNSAWRFGTSEEAPTLVYADYDGSGNVFYCEGENKPSSGAAIRIANCGTIIPYQRR